MGLVTKNYLLKDINRDYLDMIAKDYNLKEDKAEFVIKGFSLAPNEMKFDDGESSSIDILSTKALDRDGEIVDPNGVVFDVFRKHPVCVWCHDYKQLPVGKSAWIKNSAGEAIVAKTIYAVKSNPLAKQIYEYRKDGFPLGKSMGFVPVDWEDFNPKIAKGLKKRYNRVVLLEYSDVPLPSNPDALQLAVSKGLIKQDYPKMFYFHDLDIKTKDYIVEFEEEETKNMDKNIAIKKFCPICNSEQEMEEHDEEFYSCKGCGEKKKKNIVEKVAKREDVEPEDGEDKYGDVKFADEKNKKYPIDTEEHVRAALSYWGMPKNREKYSAEDQATIGGKIRAAAKKLGIGSEGKEEKEEKEEKKEVEKNIEEEVLNKESDLEIELKQVKELNDVLNASCDELTQKNLELSEQIAEFKEEIDYLSEKINVYADEIDRYKEIEEELVVVKEGRVLSSKNRKLIAECMSALQALMDATEIVGKDYEEEKAEIELFEIEEKSIDDELNFSKEDIEEITKKAVQMIKLPNLNVADIVNKVEAKIRGKAVI